MPDHLIEMEKNLLKKYKISTEEEKQSIAHFTRTRKNTNHTRGFNETNRGFNKTKLLFNI